MPSLKFAVLSLLFFVCRLDLVESSPRDEPCSKKDAGDAICDGVKLLGRGITSLANAGGKLMPALPQIASRSPGKQTAQAKKAAERAAAKQLKDAEAAEKQGRMKMGKAIQSWVSEHQELFSPEGISKVKSKLAMAIQFEAAREQDREGKKVFPVDVGGGVTVDNDEDPYWLQFRIMAHYGIMNPERFDQNWLAFKAGADGTDGKLKQFFETANYVDQSLNIPLAIAIIFSFLDVTHGNDEASEMKRDTAMEEILAKTQKSGGGFHFFSLEEHLTALERDIALLG